MKVLVFLVQCRFSNVNGLLANGVIIFSLQAIFNSSAFSQVLKPQSVATPEAAAIAKFGNIPVSPYTGLPDISIPLYTIKEGGFEIPIVLKYHASGIQVEQEATWVGLGWNLDVGGVINQQVTGVLDNDNTTLPNHPLYTDLMTRGTQNDNFSGFDMITTAYQFCRGTDYVDGIHLLRADAGRPNMYGFTLPNGSGRFFLDPLTKIPILTGNKSGHYFITRTLKDWSKSEWEIKDLNGNKFFFDVNDNAFSKKAYYAVDPNGIDSKLTYIELLNGKRINFTYENGKYRLRTHTEIKSFIGELGTNPSVNEGYITEFNTKELSRIETSNIRVEFVLSQTAAEREDLDGDQLVNGYGAKRLNAIYIWDKFTNKKIKGFKFNYGYFNSDLSFYESSSAALYLQKRLKLISINEVGYKDDGVEVLNSPYIFQYNETRNLPEKSSYARDHWGHFNGRDNRSFLHDITPEILSGILYGFNRLPEHSLNFFMSAGTANRGMDPLYATTAILNKITYPTGGYTVLNYEPNKFLNYRVFSAPEINNNAGFVTHRVDDYNYNSVVGTSVYSAPLYPDSLGRLTLGGFRCYFSRIDQSIDYGYFVGSHVTVWKVGVNGSQSAVRRWDIGTRSEFNNAGNTSFGPLTVDLTAAPGEHFIVESHLPNNPQLSMANTSIPKGVASCTFFVKNLNVRNVESVGAGLRVESVENYSGPSILADKTTYKYTKEGSLSTSGKLMTAVKNHSYFVQDKPMDENPNSPYYMPVYNMHLASYSYNPLSGDAQGGYVGYDRVEIIQESGIQANGKTVNYYKNRPSIMFEGGNGDFALSNKSILSTPYYDNGLLDSVKYFSSDNVLIKKTVNDYKLIEKKLYRGMILFDLLFGYQAQNSLCMQDVYGKPRWHIAFYPINTKWYKPSGITEFNYYSDVILKTQKGLDYNQFGQVVKEWSLNSKKDTISTAYQYPVDVSGTSGSIVQLMKDKKIYNLLLSQDTRLNTANKLEKKEYSYLQSSSSNIKLQNLKTSVAEFPAFEEVSNIRYDSSDNIISFEKEGQISAYIWGYGNQYMIAEVANAQPEDVAYTSFESSSAGNWLINSESRNIAYKKTGSQSYNLGSGCVRKLQLNVNKRYVVSYWSRSSAATISGTTAIAGPIKGGWTYYEHMLPAGSSSVDVCGSVIIDELRLFPVDSGMSTYTYQPLVGVATVADAKGKILYYNYDSFQRLKSITDEDGNIIKFFCYNYAGQLTDCGS